jgi:hypothetical protein
MEELKKIKEILIAVPKASTPELRQRASLAIISALVDLNTSLIPTLEQAYLQDVSEQQSISGSNAEAERNAKRGYHYKRLNEAKKTVELAEMSLKALNMFLGSTGTSSRRGL